MQLLRLCLDGGKKIEDRSTPRGHTVNVLKGAAPGMSGSEFQAARLEQPFDVIAGMAEGFSQAVGDNARGRLPEALDFDKGSEPKRVAEDFADFGGSSQVRALCVSALSARHNQSIEGEATSGSVKRFDQLGGALSARVRLQPLRGRSEASCQLPIG